jgi:Family of unknown function (DUF5829)
VKEKFSDPPLPILPPPAQPDSVAKVFLNHFYAVLDSPTGKAVEQDLFLRKHFAVNEKRTTTNAEMTYTGLYFYGVNTYFEFFDIADSPQHRVGDCGIAFGVDQPGAIRALQGRLGPSLESSLTSVTRLYQGKQIPWFLMATPRSLPYESELSSWVMEYQPEFLTTWNPQPRGTNQGISRREILRRYADVLEPVHAPRLEDVIALTVAADPSGTNSLSQFCLQLGYQIEREVDGDIALHGPDFILRLIPATEGVRGIREIKMRTRGLSQREEEHPLGRSVLKCVGPSAIWSFL